MFGKVRRGGSTSYGCLQRPTALRAQGHRIHGTCRKRTEVSPLECIEEGAMGLPIYRMPGRLPRRFPVGATYVVEGFGGAEGDLRVIARYVVLPGGRRINVPAH